MRFAEAKFRLAVMLLLMLVSGGVSAQTLLFPGDIVFLGYRHDDPDAFAFMLLTDVADGTRISFTDNGWNGNTGQFNTNEGTTVWTAGADYARGTIIRYDAPAAGEFTGALQGLSSVGDQIIAFQGTAANPFFVAGCGSNDRWRTEGADPTSSYSFVPPTLQLGYTVRGFQSEIDNGHYDPVGHADDGAIDTATPHGFLMAVNDSSSTWTRTSTGSGFDFPAWSLTLLDAATVIVEHATHDVDFGPVVSSTSSDPVVLAVSGFALTADVTLTAPAGFEVSLQSDSGYAGTLALTPTGGVLAETDVYLRFAPAAVQAYAGTLAIASSGAWDRELIVAGEGALALGLAQASATNGAGLLSGMDVLERAQSDQVVELALTGVADGTIGKVRVTLPADLTGLDVGDVVLGGAAFASASAAVAGSELEITGAALTDAATGTVTLSGLTTPDPTDPTDDGLRTLQTAVATDAGSYLDLVDQPVIHVTIPVANLRDYGTDYLPLDEGDVVAIDGVASVDSGVLSVSSLQVYLQDATGGMYINVIGEIIPVVRGHRYVTKGVVGHYRGNFRLTPADPAAGNIVDMGAATEPEAAIMTVAQILADPESVEGSLVHIEGLEILSGTWGANQSLSSSDDGGLTAINLRIDGDTDVDDMDQPEGAFGVTGIVYQYDSTAPHDAGYRILPRSQADFGSVSAVGDQGPSVPYALLPTAPNPFNAQAVVSFSMPQAGAVHLEVYDVSGRRVRTLVNGETWSSGTHDMVFDGLSDDGRALPSGVYFVRFQGGPRTQVDKLSLIK